MAEDNLGVIVEEEESRSESSTGMGVINDNDNDNSVRTGVLNPEQNSGAQKLQPKAVQPEAASAEVSMPEGGTSNKWNNSQTNTATSSSGIETSSNSSTSETKKVFDEDLYKQLVANIGEQPSAANLVLKLSGDDMNPDEVARKKEDADRRRRRHEGVETIRLLIEASTGAAHGRIIKRDKANYKRYEDEKDKIDATRRAALNKLYAAMQEDSKAAADLKAKLMGMAMKTVQTNTSQGQKVDNKVSGSQSNTASAGYAQPTRTNIYNGGKQANKYTYPVRVETIGKDGSRNQVQVNLEFKNGKAGYDGYMTAAPNVVNTNATLRDRAMKAMRKVHPDITEEQVRQVLYDGYYTAYYTGDDGRPHAYKVESQGLKESVLLDLLNDSEELRNIADGYIENFDEYRRQTGKRRPADGGYGRKDEREGKNDGGYLE